MKEDVTEIVLNIKGIIAKLYSEGIKTVYIEAAGEGEVTAGDIKTDSDVEVLNPEHHIATLGPEATLNMELTLSQGRGYVTADRNKPAQTVIGLIPVDSVYTPVRKVNYFVENTRVGDATDYDKLTLEVWTNGTISARDAVSLGGLLRDYFSGAYHDLRHRDTISGAVGDDLLHRALRRTVYHRDAAFPGGYLVRPWGSLF